MPALTKNNVLLSKSPWPLYVSSALLNVTVSAAALPRFFMKPGSLIIKRNMLTSKARQLIFEGKPLLENSRGFAIWVNYTRIAKKAVYPATQYVTNINGETLELMPNLDYSGKSHFNLIHKESGDFDPLYFKCYGTWTTSPSPFRGKHPIKVDTFTLEGEPITQYFHLYDIPKFVLKTAVTFDLLTTMTMANPAYLNFLEIIKNKFNLP